MISYRLDERLGARALGADSAVSMRRPRTRVVVVDPDLRIVAADEGARELLRELRGWDGSRVPDCVAAALQAARASAEGESDLLVTSIPGLLVRAIPLGGTESWSALLVERVSTREHLEAASRRFRLSPREIDVLRLLLEGDSACEIADRLAIAEYTVGDYIKRIFAKTQVRNRSEMIAKVLGWRPYAKESVVS